MEPLGIKIKQITFHEVLLLYPSLLCCAKACLLSNVIATQFLSCSLHAAYLDSLSSGISLLLLYRYSSIFLLNLSSHARNNPTNHIWSVSNMSHVFFMAWTTLPIIYGVSVFCVMYFFGAWTTLLIIYGVSVICHVYFVA